MQPLSGSRAVALFVHVTSVSSARRLSIDEHEKSHRGSTRCRPHDEMEIAGVKPVCDPPVALVQHCDPLPYRPITGEGPLIESQPPNRRDATLVKYRTTGCTKFSARS